MGLVWWFFYYTDDSCADDDPCDNGLYCVDDSCDEGLDCSNDPLLTKDDHVQESKNEPQSFSIHDKTEISKSVSEPEMNLDHDSISLSTVLTEKWTFSRQINVLRKEVTK